MKKLLSILSIAFFLTGCGSGVSTSAVSGSISAPGGSFAFNPPGKIEQFFALLIGSPAVAKIDDWPVLVLVLLLILLKLMQMEIKWVMLLLQQRLTRLELTH